jgi:serine/threonine protein kinase
VATRRTQSSGPPSQPPSIAPDVAIKLLRRQRDKAEQLLSKGAFSLDGTYSWRVMTIDVLTKGLGTDSAQTFIPVLSNWQTLVYGHGDEDQEAEDTRNGLSNSISMLSDCIELLEATSSSTSDKTTIETRPAQALAHKAAKGATLVTTFGRYTIGNSIGEGGAGRVFEVTDETGERFAAKLLDPVKAVGEKRKRFKNEIIFGIKNEHKNIIRVVDFGLYTDESGEAPFYVMPLYDGTLRKLIKTGIDRQKVLPCFAQLLDGVEAAHRLGVIHRDLKPENVLFEPTLGLLVVADFGIAQFNQEEMYTLIETRATDRLANFQYAAPEQREHGQAVDHRSDIYALGLILNELFTGEIPLGSGHKTIASVASDYSYLDELVEQMRRQSPGERPSSIAQIKQQLIAHRNDFVSHQRISNLRNTVIPEGELDDPLILDPIHLVNADYDKQSRLILNLSQPINETWGIALRSFGGHTSVFGKGPETFSLQGSSASVSASENEVQDIIRYFKEWLPRVNQKYKEIIVSEKKQREEETRRKLQAELAEEERIQRIRRSIQI